ncbi:MAG: energy-coupling factor transporter ATPase [Oscillospiraceae bacterium]|jgi:energy-coupling factor transport system ATP-binding protein|nr:energy-coupling factor transporter ATPase [Oscillospiraceae bacterium]
MEPFIRVHKVFHKYNLNNILESYALKNINFEINKSEFVVIIGANGSGKSTLAKHLNAMLLPTKGKVFVKSIDTCKESKTYEIRANVGLVLQNPDNQIVSSVVEEDVAFGLENLGVRPKEMRVRIDDALKLVDMYGKRKDLVWNLSGGQKQRVAIAGILAMKPECIVLDEVTSMLDPKGKKEVLSVIESLNKNRGVTVVLITHFMDEAVLADKIIVMSEGEIMAINKKEKIFSNTALIKKCKLSFPEPMELILSLRKLGVNIKENPLNMEDCVQFLDRFLKRKAI